MCLNFLIKEILNTYRPGNMLFYRDIKYSDDRHDSHPYRARNIACYNRKLLCIEEVSRIKEMLIKLNY